MARPVFVPDNIKHSYWRYLVTLDSAIDRQMLRDDLAENGIASDWAYYPALHLQPYFRNEFSTHEGMCPVAEDLLERNFCLPVNPVMTSKDAEFVIKHFIAALDKQVV